MKGTSFSRRDPPGASFCALSTKPSSYVQPRRGKSRGNRDWNIKWPDRNISCSRPLLIFLRYYRRPEQSPNREPEIGLCSIGFFLIRQSFVVPIVCFSNQTKFRRITKSSKSITLRISKVRLTNRIKQAGATGYILLWLLGIPIPILLLIFLLRGCT